MCLVTLMFQLQPASKMKPDYIITYFMKWNLKKKKGGTSAQVTHLLTKGPGWAWDLYPWGPAASSDPRKTWCCSSVTFSWDATVLQQNPSNLAQSSVQIVASSKYSLWNGPKRNCSPMCDSVCFALLCNSWVCFLLQSGGESKKEVVRKVTLTTIYIF